MKLYKLPSATVVVTSHCGQEFTGHCEPPTADLLYDLMSDVLERLEGHTQRCFECRVLSQLYTETKENYGVA